MESNALLGAGGPLDPVFGSSLRQLPASVEAEQALLGALLRNNRTLGLVQEYLKPEHFIDPVNGRIFSVVARLVSQGRVADPITLKSELENTGILDECGGTAFLAQLVSGAVGVDTAGDYGRVIRDAWVRRSLILELTSVLESCYVPPDGGVSAIMEQAESALFRTAEAAGPTGKRRGRSLDSALDDALAQAATAAHGDAAAGRSTGMASVDDVMGGLENATLTVLGARPGVGKSALGAQWAVSVARACKASGEKAGVGMFSLEMSATALARRILSEASRVGVRDLKRGNITGQIDRLSAARHALGGLPLWIEDAGGQKLADLRLKCRAMQRRWGRIALLVVDHMHIVMPEDVDRRQGSTQALEHISGTLRDMSKEFDCPVLALAQLSRGLLARDDKRPNLGDLRQCGAIEQDADAVAFLHRPEMFLTKTEPAASAGETKQRHEARVSAWRDASQHEAGRAELIFEKVRDGRPQTVELRFHGETTSFSEVETAPVTRGNLADWRDEFHRDDFGLEDGRG